MNVTASRPNRLIALQLGAPSATQSAALAINAVSSTPVVTLSHSVSIGGGRGVSEWRRIAERTRNAQAAGLMPSDGCDLGVPLRLGRAARALHQPAKAVFHAAFIARACGPWPALAMAPDRGAIALRAAATKAGASGRGERTMRSSTPSGLVFDPSPLATRVKGI